MLALAAARLRGQGLPAVGVHGHHLVAQGIAQPGVIVVDAAYEAADGGQGRGQAAVEGHGFQGPAVAVAADGTGGQGGFGIAVRAAHQLVQGVGRMGQIDGIPHLGGADLQQMPGLVRRGQRRGRLRIEAAGIGDAQGLAGQDQDEVLFRQRIEAEGQKHGLLVQPSQEKGAGAAAHVAVQAGQHVFHALNGAAVAGKVITGGQEGRDLAAGEVVQGYAHGSSSHCHRSAVPGTRTQAGMWALASQSLPSWL